MTVCYQCQGQGSLQSNNKKDVGHKSGNTITKKDQTANPCPACLGTGIQTSFGV